MYNSLMDNGRWCTDDRMGSDGPTDGPWYRRTVRLTEWLMDRWIEMLCDRRMCLYDGQTLQHGMGCWTD